MLKYLKNEIGAALLVIMTILSVSVVVISVLFFMLNTESDMTYNYTSRIRAMEIAESGADLAINEWIKFINYKHDSDPPTLGSPIDVAEFKNWLETNPNSPKSQLLTKLQEYYGSSDIDIRYTFTPPTTITDYETTPYTGTLIIDIEGEYDGEVYSHQATLRYCEHGDVRTYKGSR